MLERARTSRWAAASALSCALGCGSEGAVSTSAHGVVIGQAAAPIVGGSLDENTTGVVGLALDLGRGRLTGHCSGTLIAPNLVLTARHCVAFTDEGAEGIVQCDTAQFDAPMPAQLILVSPSPVRPTDARDPTYVRGREIRTLGDAEVCGFDIALIILEGAGIPASIEPIAPRLTAAPLEHELFSTVGYGLTDPDDPASDGTRQRADGSAVRCSREDCVTLSDGAIRSSEWASVDAPICSGDSGGPALDEQGRVIGVASRGDLDCGIAVYGDVSSWAPFIIDTALDAADLGDYVAPSWATPKGGSETPNDDTSASAPGSSGAQRNASGCSLRAEPMPSSAERAGLAGLVLFCLGCMQRRKSARARPTTVA